MLTVFPLIDFALPITDPTWIFFLVMAIILFAPILFEKIRVPNIIGMIIAGVIIGQFGFNILERDSSFELFGQVGLYYIMFLAGLEMDMEDFRKNMVRGIVFGVITFVVPMALGIVSGVWLLHFSVITSVLLASMFASHTLIAYPLVSRYGITRERSVTITIGGTAVTVTFALIVLAVISGMHQEVASAWQWVFMVLKVIALVLVIIFGFPYIGRWFFRKYNDPVMQFVFVLALVFLAGGLMDIAGMEGILGAFLVGIAINTLIPKVSPLMNRIEFVGNAIFIPYFLIGVGMLIDVKSLVVSGEALKVAAVMTVAATLSKWLAAWITQKIYKMRRPERMLMFGLSNAQAAATLAAVLIGHNIILPNGDRLLNDAVLNGTVVMILFTCIISTFATERAAKKLALGTVEKAGEERHGENEERLLIPVANPETIENLVNLALVIKNPSNKSELVALNVINDGSASPKKEEAGKRSLETAAKIASAANVSTEMVSRYDMNVTAGIIHTIREYSATDVVIGLHRKGSFLDSFFGSLTNNLLKGTDREVIVVRLGMPVNTMKGIVAIVPPRAEYETGFVRWVRQLCRMASGLGQRLKIYTEDATANALRIVIKRTGAATLVDIVITEGQSFPEKMAVPVAKNQMLVIVSARQGSVSYDSAFGRMASLLNRHHPDNSLIVIYPMQTDHTESLHFSTLATNS
ncbi:MAG: cation:proton antiporter [Bacteroidales bacterium]|nr:cation:proton antiporter [Bacteroidales bacterium]